jgi:hypothetical protein
MESGPGVGLEADYSVPISQAWQCDFTSRSTYIPFADNGSSNFYDEEDEAADVILYRNWQEMVNLSIACFPSTRTSVTWSNVCGLAGARHEVHPYADRDLAQTYNYDDFALTSASTLTYSCQLSLYLVANVSIGLQYNQDNQWNQSQVPMFSLQQGDEAASRTWSQIYSTSLTWRVL